MLTGKKKRSKVKQEKEKIKEYTGSERKDMKMSREKGKMKGFTVKRMDEEEEQDEQEG